ncbi:MAG: hypothetical protein IKF78_06755 [Atopobiaceae bacterium]|nr:hypothetical protein [Atopobiaceae bacterium]
MVLFSSYLLLICMVLSLLALLKKQVVFEASDLIQKLLALNIKTPDLLVKTLTRVRPQGLSRGGVFRELPQVRPQNDTFAVFEPVIVRVANFWRFALLGCSKRQELAFKTPEITVVLDTKTPRIIGGDFLG